MTDSQKWSGFT